MYYFCGNLFTRLLSEIITIQMMVEEFIAKMVLNLIFNTPSSSQIMLFLVAVVF